MIENHHVLHTLLILAFYNVGQGFNLLAGAYISSKSQLNSVNSIRHYFRVRLVPVGIRWFLCLCLFFIVWDNPSVLNLEKYMPNFSSHLGVAGLLGWASDSIWDKVLAVVLPGVNKELPPIPETVDPAKP